ncbi:hypothetical protein DNTS_003332 [Danionella cerebrum]|uniref:C2H2-type domain-containing protein n=1 Tax=Danionella cerebrum TaxID=2873325 RepID=A0A553QNW4_9TELE|nr:hypothetical protein DNTS_003332 [Danionella translucida]
MTDKRKFLRRFEDASLSPASRDAPRCRCCGRTEEHLELRWTSHDLHPLISDGLRRFRELLEELSSLWELQGLLSRVLLTKGLQNIHELDEFFTLIWCELRVSSRRVTICCASFSRSSTMSLSATPRSHSCNRTIPQISLLTKHQRTRSEGAPSRRLQSDRSSSLLLLHKRKHGVERPHTCRICSKTFISSAHLSLHLRTHSGERKYKCSICSKVFSHSSQLMRHRTVHSGEKPFKCPECNKSFGRASHLKTHSRLHTGEKPFKCGECERAFTQKAGLIIHQRTHTGERPFDCQACGKAFLTAAHLLKHQAKELKEHENSLAPSPALRCGVCEQTLAPAAAGHLFHCSVCRQSFQKISSFQKHCSKHRQESTGDIKLECS